jgi:hypothetical protein
MKFEKMPSIPGINSTIIRFWKRVGNRTFSIDVTYYFNEERRWIAHKLREARAHLREFTLEEPKKVVDFTEIKL